MKNQEDDTRYGSWNQAYGNSDANDEPIQDLLEPFSKEQLSKLLKEAAEKHLEVANRIREVADNDLVHRDIFVHGLGWETKKETLMEAFKQYGEIEDCNVIFDKNSGECKGYGFVLFKSGSSARKALKQPQKKIGNRITACNLASKGPLQHSNSEQTKRKIYVSNVGADIDLEKLLMFFSRFGEIERGPLGLDKFSGRPKGFCLFLYKSPESAKRALEDPHKTFEGHLLHCSKAIDGPRNTHNHINPRGHDLMAGGNQLGMGLLTLEEDDLVFSTSIGQAFLGSLRTATGVNHGNEARMPTGYSTQAIAPGSRTIPPGFGPLPRFQGGYQTQQPGRDGADRGHYGPGNYSP